MTFVASLLDMIGRGSFATILWIEFWAANREAAAQIPFGWLLHLPVVLCQLLLRADGNR
jgi:hypothetical protein